jgi:hypothetical protein
MFVFHSSAQFAIVIAYGLTFVDADGQLKERRVSHVAWAALAVIAAVVFTAFVAFSLVCIDAPPPDLSIFAQADVPRPSPENNAFLDFMVAVKELPEGAIPTNIAPWDADALLKKHGKVFEHMHRAAGKTEWFNPEWESSSLANGERDWDMPARACRQTIVMMWLKSRREFEKGNCQEAVSTIADLFALASLLRDNARQKQSWYMGAVAQRMAIDSAKYLLRLPDLPRRDMDDLKAAIEKHGKEWYESVPRILTAETAYYAGRIANCRASELGGTYISFLPEQFQFQPNRTKALLVDWLTRALSVCGTNYEELAWCKFDEELEAETKQAFLEKKAVRNHIGRLEVAMVEAMSYSGTAKNASQFDLEMEELIARFPKIRR